MCPLKKLVIKYKRLSPNNLYNIYIYTFNDNFKIIIYCTSLIYCIVTIIKVSVLNWESVIRKNSLAFWDTILFPQIFIFKLF